MNTHPILHIYLFMDSILLYSPTLLTSSLRFPQDISHIRTPRRGNPQLQKLIIYKPKLTDGLERINLDTTWTSTAARRTLLSVAVYFAITVVLQLCLSGPHLFVPNDILYESN